MDTATDLHLFYIYLTGSCQMTLKFEGTLSSYPARSLRRCFGERHPPAPWASIQSGLCVILIKVTSQHWEDRLISVRHGHHGITTITNRPDAAGG